MKIIKFAMQPIDTTHSTVTLILSDGDVDDPKSELLHIRTNIETHANPLVSEVHRAALQNARDVISSQFQELNNLPKHPDIR